MGLLAILGTFFSWIAGSVVVRWILTQGLLFGALKLLGRALMYVGLPIILYNVLAKYSGDIYGLILSRMDSLSLSPVTLEITGIAGWIGTQLGITNLFSMYMTAIATRFTIDLVMRRF